MSTMKENSVFKVDINKMFNIFRKTNESPCFVKYFSGQMTEKCKTVDEQVSIKESTNVQPPAQDEGNKIENKSRAIENW